MLQSVLVNYLESIPGLREVIYQARKPDALKRAKIDGKSLVRLGFNPRFIAPVLAYIDKLTTGKTTLEPKNFTEGILKRSHGDYRATNRLSVLLSHINRFNQISNNVNAISKHEFELNGSQFRIAGESVMGHDHCFSTNADSIYTYSPEDASSQIGAAQPAILAASFDGVSGSTNDQKNQTGQIASRTAARFMKSQGQKIIAKPFKLEDHIKLDAFKNITEEDLNIELEDFLLDELQLNPNDKQPNLIEELTAHTELMMNRGLRSELQKENKDGRLDRFLGWTLLDLYKFIQADSGANNSTKSDEEIQKDALDYFHSTEPDEILSKIFIEDYPTVFKLRTLFSSAQEEIKRVTESLINSSQSNLTMQEFDSLATTASIIIDDGDDFVLASLGDSMALAFDQDGIVEDSINKPHTEYSSRGGRWLLNEALAVANVKPSGLWSMLADSDMAPFDIPKPELTTSPIGEIEIRRIPKSKVSALLLLTDGICENQLHLPEDQRKEFNRFKQEINALKGIDDPRVFVRAAFNFAQKHGGGDDKSLVAILK